MLELSAVVSVLGVLAAIAVPALLRHIRRSRAAEAAEMLDQMYRGSAAYVVQQTEGSGTVAVSFPASEGPTPAEACCHHDDGHCHPDEATWASPTWAALGFAPVTPHRYQFSYLSAEQGTAAHFTARVTGDLDCDNQRSVFERTGTLDQELNLQPGRGIFSHSPLE